MVKAASNQSSPSSREADLALHRFVAAMAAAEDSIMSSSFLNGSLLHGTDESSCCPLLASLDDTSNCSQDTTISWGSIPRINAPDIEPPTTPLLSSSSSHVSTASRDLILHWKVTPPPLPASSAAPAAPLRDAASELRDIVDDMLRKKHAAQRTLADENAALRAQVIFLRGALTMAQSAPAPGFGSAITDVLAALEHERTLRANAEESRAATGKYLAEQVESVSKQKLALERTLHDFTHGREWWKAKAIAALERCEALEAENFRVKTQLNTLARKQSSVVTEQVSSMLREVAEERDRLQQREQIEPPWGKITTFAHTRDGSDMAKGLNVDAKSRFLSPKGLQIHQVPVR